jgi:ABC-2 type transport system ATP-binding protein
MMAAAVVIQNLCKSYGTVPAVKDVSFQVNPGEIFGLLGPNGAGKTTTIRCLCTLAKPDAGSIEIGGVSVIEQPREARKRLGYVAQEVALDKILTGRELLELQAALYHIPKVEARQRIEVLLEVLDLHSYADKKTGSYSGGLQRRLDLAAGLLHQPEVLVLDEPTVGLDIESRVVVWDFLRQLRASGTTILLTSHYLEEVDALADRVGIIDGGLVIAEGTPSELKNLLSDLPFVKESSLNINQGNSLNLVVTTDSDALMTIQQSLQTAGLPIFGIAQSRPSLDDVYLAATGKTLLDAELAAASSRDLKAEKKQSMR